MQKSWQRTDEGNILIHFLKSNIKKFTYFQANEVIQKFQDSNKSEHAKLKKCIKIIEEQEKVVSEKDKELNSLREELKRSSDDLREQLRLKTDVEIEQRRVREEKSELEKKLKTNETVIHWLNKQLTTAQAKYPGFRVGKPPDGLTTFTPSGIGANSTPITPIDKRNRIIEQEGTVQLQRKSKANKEK